MVVPRPKLKEIKVKFINIFFIDKIKTFGFSDSACEIHPSGNFALFVIHNENHVFDVLPDHHVPGSAERVHSLVSNSP